MLSEHFIASVGIPEKAPATNVAKDAAIFLHELQPLAAQRTIFKKSATPPNCLAVSESHVFAAQAEKAVVHVYSRERLNQEAIVPFTERITCLTLACDGTILILGTAEGRIFLWETCTGRQITTAQSHLQAVTVVAVDPTSNYLLSASADSTVHVWSIPSLLSFLNASTQAPSPSRTFASHRAGVSALEIGHNSSFANIAVTASKDKTCLVWDYHTNGVLRTYLLSSIPQCLTLDAADRAVYVGYEDAGVQQLNLCTPFGDEQAKLQSLRGANDPTAPIQPTGRRWQPSDLSVGAALSISLSFDGCTLLSGHQSGAVLAWDVASGRLQTNVIQGAFPGPVNNISFLPVAGFLHNSEGKLKVHAIVKPKFGAFDSADGFVPGNYSLNVEFPSNLRPTEPAFQQALIMPTFPQNLIDEGLSQLASWGNGPVTAANSQSAEESEDFMALDGEPDNGRQLTLEEQNGVLKAQLDALRRLQSASFTKIDKINAERQALLQREQKRVAKRGVGKVNGVLHHDADDMNDTGTSSDSD